MTRLNLSTLATAASAILFCCSSPRLAWAGGEGFSKETIDSKYSQVDLGKFKANPWHISVSVRGGYDDNVDLSAFDERGSAFINGALGLTYNFGSPRTKLSLNGGLSLTYYFDDGEDDGFNSNSDDIAFNTWLSFNLLHRATPRLTLGVQAYAAYISAPGFDTFNANLFAVDRRNQDYFQTTNKFSLGYAWTPRFSTVSSYTLGYIDYTDDVISRFEDRFEHTFGNEFRFLIAPTTTVVGEYRFGIVDYINEANLIGGTRDSHSHFFLAGVDHSFSPRFNVSVRGGVEVREFDVLENDPAFLDDIDTTEVGPYFEGTMTYAIAQRTSLTWTNRYAMEQPNVPDALRRQTFRSSIGLRHAFTPRIIGLVNAGYQHDNYDETFLSNSFTEDAIDLALTLRYAMNRNLAFDLGYSHTQLWSDGNPFREYARNQFWAGATWTW